LIKPEKPAYLPAGFVNKTYVFANPKFFKPITVKNGSRGKKAIMI
jgi:hypothetical protein